MIQLKEIELSMQAQVEKIRSTYGHRAASHGFASIYIWKEEMRLRIYLEEQIFILKFGLWGEHAWFYPCGEPGAVKELISDILREDQEAVFYYMREQDAVFLAQEFPGSFFIREFENDSEYLYDRWQQQELKGKKFCGQRNHINRVKADHQLSVEKLDEHNLQDALKVNQHWERRSLQEVGLRDEQAGEILLENRESLGVFGILVRVDNRPYAIAAGYSLCEDVFDLALVKQVECLTGLSVYTRNQLIRLLPERYQWINAEEDLGVEGLRTMKRQMKPAGILKMYTACHCCSSDPGSASMIVKAEISSLGMVQKLIVQNEQIPDNLKKRLCLAAEEIFVNICSYAYEKESGTVEISLNVDREIILKFSDTGKPFNPLENMIDIEDYDLEEQIGGLGRRIAFGLADKADYQYENNKNVLTMILER